MPLLIEKTSYLQKLPANLLSNCDYHATVNPVPVRDLHATLLHLLGINHEELTYRFQSLDMRLTGVEPARVVKEVLA